MELFKILRMGPNGHYALQDRNSITWLVLKNWGFNRIGLNQWDSFCLKRVIFQENISDIKEKESHTDMSDDMEFQLIYLTLIHLMFTYLEKLKFFPYLWQIEQCLIYQLLQSTVWFHHTCSIHVQILSDNKY